MLKKYHLQEQPIKDGYRIYEQRLSLVIMPAVRAHAASFCSGSGQTLSLKPEPANSVDRNALTLVGQWKGWFFRKEAKLGYVPKEVAANIAKLSLAGAVEPRLLKTYISDGGFTEIEYQLLGPDEMYELYRPPKVTPASRAKDFVSEGKAENAIVVLLKAIEDEEIEANRNGYGVSARNYKQLAAIYKKSKMPNERYAILERFSSQKIANGRNQEALLSEFNALKQKKEA